jgi:ubiquitin C-terminal hydrolase
MKRFSSCLKKIHTHVTFPLEGLDLKKYLSKNRINLNIPSYDLLGVSHHIGRSVSNGHYIAHVNTNGYSNTSPTSNNTEASEDGVQEDKDGSRWMCFDDETVSSLTCPDFKSDYLGRSAYVLFYSLSEFEGV